jgi:hypothetical protein
MRVVDSDATRAKDIKQRLRAGFPLSLSPPFEQDWRRGVTDARLP